MLNDVRFALRLIARQRLFAVIVTLTFALGIGINTLFFAIVNGFLFHELRAHEPARLQFIYLTDPAVPNFFSGIRYSDYLDLKERSDLFFGVLARGVDHAQIVAGGDMRRARGEMVSGNYFDVLGVQPALGRTLMTADDSASAAPVVVISNDLWSARFNSDPDVLGTTILLDARAYTIIGIMPREFDGTLGRWERSQYWVSLLQRATDRQCRQPDILTHSGFSLVGRLRDNVSPTQAQTALSAVRLAPTSVRAYATPSSQLWTPTLRHSSSAPLPFDPAGQVVPTHLAAGLLGLGFVVLLIASLNLGGMLSARALTRENEIATRLALGAPRWRLTRQLFCESLLLSLGGGLLGLLLARWGIAIVAATVPAQFAPFNLSLSAAIPVLVIDAPVDWRVGLYTLALAVFSGVVVGLGPAFRARRSVGLEALTNMGALTPRQANRLRHWVVVPQICLSLGLLLVAGILVRTLTALGSMVPGYRPAGLVSVTFDVSPPWSCEVGRRQPSSVDLDAFFTHRSTAYERLLRNASSIDGVVAVGLTASLPLEAPRSGGSWMTGRDGRGGSRPTTYISRIPVSPTYIETLNVQIVSGRTFDAADFLDEGRVVILSAAAASALWGDRNPIGRQVAFQEASSPRSPAWYEVIGVANDMNSPIDQGRGRPAAFVPLTRNEYARVLVARTTGSPAQTIRDLKFALDKTDPDVQIGEGALVSERIESFLYPRRVATTMLSGAGVIGLVLAALGVYGVVSYSVAQRTREIGVRIALGADARDVTSLILREGSRVAVIGGVLGIAFGYAAVRVTSRQIAPLPALDVPTLLVASIVLAGAVLLACYLPAIRASRTDPMVALREL